MTAAAPTYRENLGVVVAGIWMIVGLFVDGWAHENDKPETFFTPWHALLYSGFGFAVVLAALQLRRRHEPGRSWLDAVPEGQALTLAALGVFGLGAVGDLVWHEVLGIELGVEALLSPTHLLLLTGGLVAVTGPLRSAWTGVSRTDPSSLRSFLPPLLSLLIATALAGFFLLYLSPFVVDAAGTAFTRVAGAEREHGQETRAELRQLVGVASILMTTVLLVVPALLLRGRWRPPAGSYTLFFGVLVTMFVALDEFGQAPLLLAGVAAGLAADALVKRDAPMWALGAAIPAVLWTAYFALYQLFYGVEWTAELWAGVTVLSALIGAGIGFAAREPARASAGPIPRRSSGVPAGVGQRQ